MFSIALSTATGRRVRSAVALMTAVTTGGLFAAQSGADAATRQWSLSIAATNGPDNGFKGVDAVGDGDVWAVGTTNAFSSTVPQNTLIEHWNGTRWSITPSPNVPKVVGTYPSHANVLSGVEAISSGDVWAVGHTAIGVNDGSQSLVEHWNGRSWSVVPSPNGVSPSPGFYNFLNGVSGTASTDVWAVGWNGAVFNQHRATIQHWDGTKWSLVRAPLVGGHTDHNTDHVVLNAVTAIAPNDAWAVGTFRDEVNGPIGHPLTLHWDGVTWNVVNAVDVSLGTTSNQVLLNSVKAVSPNNVWVVGNVLYTDAEGASQSQAVIEHWDGSKWSLVRSPSPDGTATTLTGLSVLGANDIWALGTSGSPQAGGARDPLLEHWDGTNWTAVSAPRPDKNYNCGFFAAAASGGAQGVGTCIAANASLQPRAFPFAELFR